MSLFPPGFVTIGEVARELATPGVDANPSDWHVDDADRSDLRRDIAIAIGVAGTEGIEERPSPGVLNHVRLMWEQGKITPRSPGHAFPPTSSDQIGPDWLLSAEDAARLRKTLTLVPPSQSTDPVRKPAPVRTPKTLQQSQPAGETAHGAQGANARWAHLEEFKATALRYATERPFPSRAEAAKYAADMLEDKPGTKGKRYDWTTVDKWLRELGWPSAHDSST